MKKAKMAWQELDSSLIYKNVYRIKATGRLYSPMNIYETEEQAIESAKASSEKDEYVYTIAIEVIKSGL